MNDADVDADRLAKLARRIGVVFLVLAAFGIEASLSTAALVVVLNGASTLVPVPGGAGTQQVLAAYALQGAVSAATAVSFSLGMQVGVTIVNTTVGLLAATTLAAAWSHSAAPGRGRRRRSRARRRRAWCAAAPPRAPGWPRAAPAFAMIATHAVSVECSRKSSRPRARCHSRKWARTRLR